MILTLGGIPFTKARISVPASGVWTADVDMAAEKDVPTGRVVLQIGDTAMQCTVDADATGDFQGLRRLRVYGGAAGWRKVATVRSYANDAGVKASVVAGDAAADAGETLSWTSTSRIAAHYTRNAVPYSQILDDVAPGWHVDFDGVTRVDARANANPQPTDYDVIDYNARDRVVELVTSNISKILPGAVISNRLPTALTISAVEYVINPDGFRVFAFCRPADCTELADALVAIARHALAGKLYGAYRYRVVQTEGDRVTLQAVSKAPGLPDLTRVDMWPGVAGCHAQLTPGAHVMVEFEAGDRGLPFVSHFIGKGGDGFSPVRLDIGNTTGKAAVRLGDSVEVDMPQGDFTGTLDGAPITGTISFVSHPKAFGRTTDGSGKVFISD
jgi:hypothetical protein